ncbi:DNA polymerase III subunit alpha [Planomicrobium sp. YIM 101495]|uniref:DNA polymerase III subunit alpha n=1 Tax=Planomicrobium sp. YIM 101495 TaxID=2665160 RepID=UPI0013FB6E85|nr:DNA polymerase III subunit alpha [Planomicrobium sp. YIM 101495]
MAKVYPYISTSADLLKSTVRLNQLFPLLKQQGAVSAAIVNTTLYGVLPFWEACKQAGIHGVIGFSSFIDFEAQHLPVTFYAKTQQGYENLLKISSALGTRDRKSIPQAWLKAYAEGLYCLVPNKAVWTAEGREDAFAFLKSVFGDLVLGAVERPGGVKTGHEELFIERCEHTGMPIMAIHEVRYLKKEDAFALEVASAISQGVKLGDPEWQTPPHTDAYVPEPGEFEDWFQDQPQWIGQTEQVLASCHVTIQVDQKLLPIFPLPEGVDHGRYLRERCEQGLKERVPEAGQAYMERLGYELGVIDEMGYNDYFLIVSDFMAFARSRDILTGPGRGSSASSLVAYVLRITDVDPLHHGLLFERFLNPERITLPDIDIDFADHRRHEVVEYVAQKYGQDYTAQIITFGTLSAKAVARDTARVFGFEKEELDAISKLIPGRLGIQLKQAFHEEPRFKEWVMASDIRKKWLKTATQLEGLPRHASTHAAGVILSPVPLVRHVPIETGSEGVYLTQWPMKELEAIGLLKMDFLGLRNLTILDKIRFLVKKDTGHQIDYRALPLDDQATYELLAKGETLGVFQLESEGMRKALRQIKPTMFGDIVAVNALYRPGPMEFIPLYARRKHGQERVDYSHPDLEPILKETYGVIVYQEQIMQIASKMAGFSLGAADLLRRAVSKKERHILDQERKHFVDGARTKGYGETSAQAVYDLIVRFADYGFAKSHAVAYSMISYQLAFMKANYPVHFYAALLASHSGNNDKTNQFFQELKDRGIRILPPSIQSEVGAYSVESGNLRIGLYAVKGVPGSTVRAITEARKDGEFTSIYDIAARISAIHFSRKTIEPLIKAGALDAFGKDRGVLLSSLDGAVKHAELVRPNEEPGLFDDSGFSFLKPKYAEASPIPEELKLDYEKESLGFYVSTHPVEREKKIRGNAFADLKDIRSMRHQQQVKVLGMVEEIKRIRTKKGDAMAFLTLQDDSAACSLTLFPKEYAAFSSLLEEHRILEVEGTVENRQGKIAIQVKDMKK